MHGRDENACKIIVGKSQGKRSLGRPRCGWQDDIKMDLKETEFEDVDWLHVAQNRVQEQDTVYTVINLQFSYRDFLTR
jgi:hypothetical protein